MSSSLKFILDLSFFQKAQVTLIMDFAFVNIDQINNNLLECSDVNHEKEVKAPANKKLKSKYTRSELKSLIKSPVKAGTKNILLPCSDSDCGEVFWSKWSLQKHVKQRHVEKTFPCSFCGKTFIYEANRKDHVKDSHKPKAKLAKGKSKSNVNVKSKSAPKPKQIKRKEGLQSQSTHRGAK